MTEMFAAQNKNTEFCAPLTSFDWNENDPNIIGTSSIDTTCTIWDIEVPNAIKLPLPPNSCATNPLILLFRVQ